VSRACERICFPGMLAALICLVISPPLRAQGIWRSTVMHNFGRPSSPDRNKQLLTFENYEAR
jgi:hypothetical protein